VVAGHGLKNTLIIEVLQVKIARRIPANVNPGKHRKPRADALNVGGLAAHNVSAFALLNESVTEIRPQGESIVPKETENDSCLCSLSLQLSVATKINVCVRSSCRLSIVSPGAGTVIGLSPAT